MSSLNRIVVATLILILLALPTAPRTASAQAGTRTYEITVTNINNSKQGLSPLVVATHPASVHAWQMGQLASKGLEMLAEEGMPDLLAGELKGVATDVAVTHAHLLPGDSITVRIAAKPGDVLSAGSMLIQTNDGFTGLDGVPLTDGDKDTVAYDAGTEDNSELATVQGVIGVADAQPLIRGQVLFRRVFTEHSKLLGFAMFVNVGMVVHGTSLSCG